MPALPAPVPQAQVSVVEGFLTGIMLSSYPSLTLPYLLGKGPGVSLHSFPLPPFSLSHPRIDSNNNARLHAGEPSIVELQLNM